MTILTGAATLNGTTGDDILAGNPVAGANTTLFGNDGDDLILGDSDHVVLTVALGQDAATAHDLTGNAGIWSLADNPDIADATTVPHATILAEGDGTEHWLAVTMAAGATLVADLDYGTHAIGGNVDAELWVLGPDGVTPLAQDGDTSPAAGAGGSTSVFDPLVTFVAPAAGTYYIRIVAAGGVPVPSGVSYVLNVSLTGQIVTGDTPFDGNDSLDGGAGNDVLYGGGGHDRMEGGADNDLLDGGEGDDRVYGGAGNDALRGGAGIDTVYGGTGNDSLDGGAGNDILNAGAGADRIEGGAGDDFLWESDTAGADTYIGGAGSDTYDVSTILAGFVIDLAAGFAQTGGITDSLSEVENVQGSQLGDLINGSDADNSLYGNGGADDLSGGDGDDRLYGGEDADRLDGGTGNDTMDGGTGNDIYWVDSLGDVIQGETGFAQGGGIDTIWTAVNYAAPANVELIRALTGAGNLTLTGNDAPGTLVGNEGNNSLNGRGGNDQINGNTGNDSLTGGEGVDTLVGGAGADTFVYTSVSNSRAGAASRDVINGFDRGAVQDRIDLSAIDANTLTFGVDDAFTFIGATAFSGQAGQLRTQSLGGPNAILIEGDINGDRVADLQIFVNTTNFMTGGDFIL